MAQHMSFKVLYSVTSSVGITLGKIQGGFGVTLYYKLPLKSIILQSACRENSKETVLNYIFRYVVNFSMQRFNI